MVFGENEYLSIQCKKYKYYFKFWIKVSVPNTNSNGNYQLNGYNDKPLSTPFWHCLVENYTKKKP